MTNTLSAKQPGSRRTAEVAKFIDVICVFDAVSIIENAKGNGTPTQPEWVDPKYVYMTTRSDSMDGGPGAELTIMANTDDTIRWREVTASGNANYSALLYNFICNDSNNTLISKPEVRISSITKPLPRMEWNRNPDDPRPDSQSVKDHFWTSDVLNPGEVQYSIRFMLLDGMTIKGYFSWDPYITIKQR